MDLFFQIYPASEEDSFKKAAKLMKDLCRYYDKKTCLNTKHSEIIIDVFRFCISRDPDLSAYLDAKLESLDEMSNPTDTAQTNPSVTVAPQLSMMEVDVQSRLDWLLNKNAVMSKFERTLDGLISDGQNLLAEFVDWQASGPTYSYNDLRNELCGDAKFKFDASKVSLFGLVYTCKESKKDWISRTTELTNIEYRRHPKKLEELLDIDEVFDS